MNITRKSTFADIISVVAWQVVSTWSNGRTYDLLHFMMSGRLTRGEASKVVASCRMFLLHQFPEFSKPRMAKLIARLDDLVSRKSELESKKVIINSWTKYFEKEYKATFEVRPLPHNEAEALISGFCEGVESVEKEEDVIRKSTG